MLRERSGLLAAAFGAERKISPRLPERVGFSFQTWPGRSSGVSSFEAAFLFLVQRGKGHPSLIFICFPGRLAS